MSAQPLTIHVVTQRLEGEVLLAEPFLFPPVQLCHTSDAQLAGHLRELVLELAGKLPPLDWHRHVLHEPPTTGRLFVTIDPPKRQQAWAEPLECAFDYIWWQSGESVLGYVPALRVAIIAESFKHLEKIAPDQIKSALRRQTAGDALYRLALIRRVESIALQSSEVIVPLPTPKQQHSEQAEQEDRAVKPLIEQVGQVLSSDAHLEPAYVMEPAVSPMAEALAGRPPRSVLLVGAAGVGKTAAVRELVRGRGARGLGDTPFWSTSGARLVAGMSGFGMWQERCTQLCREAAKASAIVHLGSLFELMEVGKAETIGQGIAGFLKPHLIRGSLLAIAECTPEQLTRIERTDPHLLDGFQIVRVNEPMGEVGRRIIANRAAALGRGMVLLSEDGLATLDRLHRRYAGYSTYPSRPLRFVQNLVLDLHSQHPDGYPQKVTLDPAEITTAFARQTGLPPFLLDDDIPLDPSATRTTFGGRVIGQPEAVDLVTDLITTVKAGMTRPRRPIASLLFIGPTGVGKTEMAKTLAEFFFSSQDRMTRFDMSEFATPVDVQRLVGGVLGSEGLLTAKVREQPFSVILLDEVEKAHPLLFDLLLQVLGEGRLTDAAGRVADFTNAVVIMTSNLGAESFQRGGFGVREARGGLDAKVHFVEEVRSFLRPELFNRIDRIVPFLPLDEATVEKIVRRELDLVARRDGILLRNVGFAPGDDVVRYLSRKGYDRIYGARPLKRLIERELLVPLADGINGYADQQRLTAEVGVAAGGRLSITVRAVADTGGTVQSLGNRWAEAARATADLRRRAQRLHRTTAVLAVQNEFYSLQRAEQLELAAAEKRKKSPPFDPERTRRIGRLAAVIDAAADIQRRVIELEDRSLDAVYGDARPGDRPAAIEAEAAHQEKSFTALLSDLFDLRYDQPDQATVVLFGRRLHQVTELARAYIWTAGAGVELKAWWFGRDKNDDIVKHQSRKPEDLLRDPPDKVEGVMLSLRSPHAMLRFEGEVGIHLFKLASEQDEVFVDVSPVTPAEYAPPAAIASREPIPEVRRRREYLLDRSMANDSRMTGELRWGGRGFKEAVAKAIDDAVAAVLTGLLEQEQKA